MSVSPNSDLRTSGDDGRRRRLCGLLVRRECWTLSWPAKILLLLLLFGGAVVLRGALYPFLAVSKPVRGDFLVVEGWTPGYGLEQVPAIFQQGRYRKILTVGGDRHAPGRLEPIRTYAGYAASCLKALGMSELVIEPVPYDTPPTDRTYHAALAIRRWLREHGSTNASVDVLTVGAHARRSRLMFEKAFGGESRIGVISAEERSFDPQHWWQSSQGFRDVVGETIAYPYAVYFYWLVK